MLWRLLLPCIPTLWLPISGLSQTLHPIALDDALAQTTIKSVVQNPQGGIFALTDRGQCFALQAKQASVTVARSNDRKMRFEALLASDSEVLLLVNHCELHPLTRADQPPRTFTTTRFATTVQPTVSLMSRKGDVFVGTEQDGLFHFKTTPDGRFTPSPTRLSMAEGMLPSNAILSLFEDSMGILWIGTDRGLATLATDGVHNLNPVAVEAPAPRKRNRDRDVIIPTYSGPVRGIVEWGGSIVFTDGYDLFKLANIPDRPTYIYKHPFTTTPTASEPTIRQLLVDTYGYIWIAHQALTRYNPTTGELMSIGREQGLRGQAVSQLVEDIGQLQLWVGTIKGGIYVMDNDHYQQIGH